MVVSDSTYKRQKSEARLFFKWGNLTPKDFRDLNTNANRFELLLVNYSDYLKAKSKRSLSYAYILGVRRLVNTGVKRFFVESRNGGVRCDLDFEDLVREVEKWLLEGIAYIDVIRQDIFPSPIENFSEIEVIEKNKGKTDSAFVGHYIKVNMHVSEFLKVIGEKGSEFDFDELGNLLSEFFNNAVFWTEDFLNENVKRIAFRLSFEGGEYNENEEEIITEEFIRIKFSNSYGALKSKLHDMIKKRKENYKNFQKDPIINWILPIFPLFDSVGNFSKDEGNRLGVYIWYRGNLVDF